MQTEKPIAYLLVGVPGSGKSTWAEPLLLRHDFKLVSTDNYIETIAASLGKTYGQIFQDTIGAATKAMENQINELVALGEKIIWDQTNLTPKSRRRKLDQLVAAGYDVTAVAFECPAPELKRRREKREAETGKHIPPSVVETMTASYVRPTRVEGFHSVIIVTPVDEYESIE